MLQRIARRIFFLSLLIAIAVAAPALAQEAATASTPDIPPPFAAPLSVQELTPPPPPAPLSSQLVVPLGTRLPLVLRNGINTRTAKPGDSVYFETAYPIAANNRIAIPMGTFMRGEILEAKRPGRIKGRGEIRMALRQMTFLNGYTIDLVALPSSVDPNSGAGVDAEGKIKGPSSATRDTTAVLLTTAGGAYIGTIAGGIINGAPGKGAFIGGGVGTLSALIAVLATRGPEAELPRGTLMDVVFDRPLILDATYLPANAGPGIDPQPRYTATSQDTRARRRPAQRDRSASSLLLPFLFLPLLR
jgi:type IV secretion system protein VirB10